MANLVLDASALLALILGESGADEVAEHVPEASVSAVNLAEVVGKLTDARLSEDVVRLTIRDLGIEIVPFDQDAAFRCGFLRRATRPIGLSLGDRACLALAQARSVPAITADRRWQDLRLDVEIRVIRGA